ncbi:DUF6284 family protein [Streptomyces sp. JNUCC 64]
MKPIILPVSSAGLAFDGEPSDVELDAIEVEGPLISAELELLDVEIAGLDRPVSEWSVRRERRARRRVLAARAALAHRTAGFGGAA